MRQKTHFSHEIAHRVDWFGVPTNSKTRTMNDAYHLTAKQMLLNIHTYLWTTHRTPPTTTSKKKLRVKNGVFQMITNNHRWVMQPKWKSDKCGERTKSKNRANCLGDQFFWCGFSSDVELAMCLKNAKFMFYFQYAMVNIFGWNPVSSFNEKRIRVIFWACSPLSLLLARSVTGVKCLFFRYSSYIDILHGFQFSVSCFVGNLHLP